MQVDPGNGRNGALDGGPKVWHTADARFAILVSTDWRPVACKQVKATGQWTTFDLSTLPGNPLASPVNYADSHQAMAIAVDGQGYVYVAGNMHSHPFRLVRTAQPGDIGSWVDVSAAIRTAASGSGDSLKCTYPFFYGFGDGTLLLQFAQQDVGSIGPLGRDTVLYRLDPTVGATWQPATGNGELMTANGVTGVDARAYLFNGFVDASEVLHIVGVWRPVVDEFNGQRQPFYVRSDDKGVTWTNVLGQALATPFTSDVTRPLAATVDGQLTIISSVCVDGSGHPHYTTSDIFERFHTWWDGSGWQAEAIASQWDATPAIGLTRRQLWYVGERHGEAIAETIDGATTVHLGPGMTKTPRADHVDFPDNPSPMLTAQALRAGVLEAWLPEGDRPMVRTLGDGAPVLAAQ